jgi:serine/threonine-protein kinase
MGQVYLARQLSLKREVALKILRKDLATDATSLQRFRAEAEAVARVTHSNIVQVYAVGEQDGLHYMALEYVAGRNLRDYLARKGAADLAPALAIMRQVAAALQRAGELGLVHRDIKPENILVTRKAEVKVADFGLSRALAGEAPAMNLTQTGVTLGTPLYMSPEQVQGHPVDQRSDIYSFGVTCYHLLSGEPPFKGATAFEVALQHVQNTPPPLAETRPDLPADLSAMVHKMMAKRPEDRYQSATAVLRDIARVREGLGLGLGTSGSASAFGSMTGFDFTPSGTNSLAKAGATTVLLPRSRTKWAAGGVLVLALAAIGWLAVGLLGRPSDTASSAGPGLPTNWPKEPWISARERSLKEKFESRSSTPDQVLHAGVELGLQYVKDGRLDEATDVFTTLEKDRPDRAERLQMRTLGNPFQMAGLCGKAIVLSAQNKPDVSDAELLRAHAPALRPLKGGPPKARTAGMVLQNFLVQFPDLSRAVADAVLRNEENLAPKKKALPNALQWLKTPASLVAGPRG